MGRPKALLPWGETDLLGHALHRLVQAGLQPVCLGPLEWAQRHGAAQISDAVPGAGPLAGILAALREGDAFVLAVDMPLLTAEEIRSLAAEGKLDAALVLPAQGGVLSALCGYWPAALAVPLSEYLAAGGRRVIAFAEQVEHRFLDPEALSRLGVKPEHLAGLNTPEEYAAALREAGLEGEVAR